MGVLAGDVLAGDVQPATRKRSAIVRSRYVNDNAARRMVNGIGISPGGVL
jgi:hypothetical protein